MKEVIATQLVWHDLNKEKPKYDSIVLTRVKVYYHHEFKEKVFSIGCLSEAVHNSDFWCFIHLGNFLDSRYHYIVTQWTNLPKVSFIDDAVDIIENRFEIMEL